MQDQRSNSAHGRLNVPFDSKLQRHIMGRFATGVTVVTTVHDGVFSGLTANAVTSLSLSPPLVLVAVEKTAHSHSYMLKGRVYAMNILAEDQADLSQRFATRGPKDFGDLQYTVGETGAPILAGTLGYVDCRVVEVLPGGDHDIFVGEIVAGEAREGRPLLYFGGKYENLA
jgi:flavin reductase (DIM6/NTAB) family NADH-FMN oxidoreductase RutF